MTLTTAEIRVDDDPEPPAPDHLPIVASSLVAGIALMLSGVCAALMLTFPATTPVSGTPTPGYSLLQTFRE